MQRSIYIHWNSRKNAMVCMDDVKIYFQNEKSGGNTETTWILSQDIGKEFGIEKCAMIVISKRKKQEKEETEQPD